MLADILDPWRSHHDRLELDRMRTVQLLPAEISILDRQDPTTENDGGWQQLLVQLQAKVNRATGEIVLTGDDLERIPRYAFDYGNGGWESRLTGIFSRTLGPFLGRTSRQA